MEGQLPGPDSLMAQRASKPRQRLCLTRLSLLAQMAYSDSKSRINRDTWDGNS